MPTKRYSTSSKQKETLPPQTLSSVTSWQHFYINTAPSESSLPTTIFFHVAFIISKYPENSLMNPVLVQR